MAEAPSVQSEEVRVKGTFAGQAVDLAAKGTTIILLFALAVIGYLALTQHSYRNLAEQQILSTLHQQNDLLQHQTELLRDGQNNIECQLGLVIFNYQFPKGQTNWDDLPPILQNCLPEYNKKLPRKRKMKKALKKIRDANMKRQGYEKTGKEERQESRKRRKK